MKREGGFLLWLLPFLPPQPPSSSAAASPWEGCALLVRGRAGCCSWGCWGQLLSWGEALGLWGWKEGSRDGAWCCACAWPWGASGDLGSRWKEERVPAAQTRVNPFHGLTTTLLVPTPAFGHAWVLRAAPALPVCSCQPGRGPCACSCSADDIPSLKINCSIFNCGLNNCFIFI